MNLAVLQHNWLSLDAAMELETNLDGGHWS